MVGRLKSVIATGVSASKPNSEKHMSSNRIKSINILYDDDDNIEDIEFFFEHNPTEAMVLNEYRKNTPIYKMLKFIHDEIISSYSNYYDEMK